MILSKKNWEQDLQDIRVLVEGSNNMLLNELIFVRAVSALEIYLVESIKDIFTARPQLFCLLNKEITFHYGELLTSNSLSSVFSKLLKRETQQLSRIGFDEVLKFYKKLRIDLNDSKPGQIKMSMYHEIRHLIVHRLGEVDDRFKKNYNYYKEKIVIDDIFLNKALSDFDDFVNDSNQKILNALNALGKKKSQKKRQTIIIQVWFDRDSRNEIINLDTFIFRNGDELFFLSDIEINRVNQNGSVILTLKSTPTIINYYLQRLESESNKYTNFHFEILNVTTQSNGKSKSYRNVSNDNFEKIKSIVGESRVSKDLKRQISRELNLSGNQVKSVFNQIVKERISIENGQTKNTQKQV